MLFPEDTGLNEDQQGFLLFIRDLSAEQLRSTYKSYCFLAEFRRADEIWKRDALHGELTARKLPIPESRVQPVAFGRFVPHTDHT
jgi:hypothetical protein